MLQIKCPFCGCPRDEEEFTYGGPYERTRPDAPAELSDEQWSTYLFTRDNTRGVTRERWRHTFGCRQWFGIERHTETHEISATFRLDESQRRSSVARLGASLGESINEAA